MIDIVKLRQVLDGYKAYFPSHWDDEMYKWEAIKHFQDHWNIDAENFGEMFKKATDKTFNLLASGYAYPRGMMINFAKADDDAVRQMFRDLYDESRDLAERVDAFQNAAEEIRVKYDDGTWRNHYQNTNAISVYLWLQYPEKYYIYRYEIYRDVATELNSEYRPKRNGSVDSLIGGFKMYDEICKAVSEDTEVVKLFRTAVSASCYPDPKLRTVTVDVGFYLSRFFLGERKVAQEEEDWFPKDYDPHITVNEWVEMLADSSVFTQNALQIMKRMKDYGGQATCTQLSIKYGENQNFYNGGSTALARRVAKKTGCKVMTGDNENVKWSSILYMGKKASETEAGAYVWRLRSELARALKMVDLSDIPLYVEETLSDTKESRRYIREENPVKPVTATTAKYTKADFLSKVFMTEERYDVLEALLRNKMNIILQGAPGVGKTFTAKKLAYAMMGEVDDSRIELVQFHQNYSYEDFVMGYRPDGAGFKLTNGIFYCFCQTAANHPDKEYFFIIDEINRGNLSKIFGELMMLIEKEYRGTKATLAYNGMPFAVPENLYIIGMMNTADRSLAMIDYALRRRFSFFEMEPGFNSEGFQNYQKAFANETFNALIDQVKVLNKEIAEDPSLGRGFRIGHSYFCGREEGGCTTDWMRSVVEFDILPMLAEYWFDEPAKLQRWEKNLRGVFDDE